MYRTAAFARGASRAAQPDTWRKDAACRNMDPAIFFPVGLADEDTPMALMTCRGCPVRIECLTTALAVPTTAGIWGGTTEKDRERIRRRRRRIQGFPT